jgi:hypothetical protein
MIALGLLEVIFFLGALLNEMSLISYAKANDIWIEDIDALAFFDNVGIAVGLLTLTVGVLTIYFSKLKKKKQQ